jgi:hypothetical protein
VGGQLLGQWHFPDTLLAAVEYHHLPAKAPGKQFFAQVIQLADLLSFFCIESEAGQGDDVIAHLQLFLPDLMTRWRGMGIAWNDEHCRHWYSWLCTNREQSGTIRGIFSA